MKFSGAAAAVAFLLVGRCAAAAVVAAAGAERHLRSAARGNATAVAVAAAGAEELPHLHAVTVVARSEPADDDDDAPERTTAPVDHTDDYNAETPIVIWSGERLPLTVETIIALSWVTMVALMPFIIVWLEGGKTTRTQWVSFAVMWVVLVGGILLFTNIILFQSAHFDHVRPLTVVECVYLLSQILTTVGYGDITPAKPRGQVFIGLYVIFSLIIIANIVAEVSDIVAERTREYLQKLSGDAAGNVQTWSKMSKPKIEYTSLIKHLCVYFSFVAIGVVFFTLYPGEGKTVLQAIYMSIITLSTVGFGAVTPVTEAGKVFGAFWMLFGSASLVALIGAFTEVMEQAKARERFCPKTKTEDSMKMANAMGSRTDLAGFLKFALLQSHAVTQDDLDEIERTFKELSPDSQGTVSTQAAAKYLLSHEVATHLSPRTHHSVFGLHPGHHREAHAGS